MKPLLRATLATVAVQTAAALLLGTSTAFAQTADSPNRPYGAASPSPPVAPPPSGPGGPVQELYVALDDGFVYRVQDYATNPQLIPVKKLPCPPCYLFDIAFDPTTGLMYSSTTGAATRFDTYDANFDPTYVADNPNVQNGNALDYGGDGTLWMRSPFTNDLFQLDPATGNETFVATLTAPSAGDVAVDAAGRVLASTSIGTLDVYDPATGIASSLGPHGLSLVYGLEVDRDGTVYAFEADGDLYTIDLTTMTPTLIGNVGLAGGLEVYGCAFVLPADRDSIGTSYCGPAVPNSSGLPGVIAATGSVLVVDDDVTLTACDLPPNQFGYFLNSQTQGFVANPGGSQGNLCLGGAIGRYNRPGEVASSGAAGSFALALDLTDTPQPAGPVSIQPGETWNFTAWFRDQNPGVTSNFTDAVSIDFQ